ncbi:MAG: hypothetical protein ABIJ09_06355 [Pseudomonadota bacterium]
MRATLTLVLCVMLLGCPGRSVDPLAEERARLVELEREALIEGWPAEAVLVVPAPTLAAKIQQGFANALAAGQDALHLEPGLGVSLDAIPDLQVAGVQVEPSAECAQCVRARVQLKGTLALKGSGWGLQLEHEQKLHVSLAGVMESWLTSEGGVHRVQARPRASETWTVLIEIESLPSTWNQGLARFIEQQVEKSLQEKPWPPVDVLEVEGESPVRLRGIRLEAGPDGGLIIALAFAALTPGTVSAIPSVESGILLLVPETTALALVRATALRQAPVDGHAVEPLRIEFREDRFELWLRIWEVSSRPTARDFHVRGLVRIEEQRQILLEAQGARELGPTGQRYDPLSLLTRAAILQKLGASLSAALPATVRRESLGQVAALRVVGVQGQADALTVRMQLELTRAELPAPL